MLRSLLLCGLLVAASARLSNCTEGDTLDSVGFSAHGEPIGNPKPSWRRYEQLLIQRGMKTHVGIADCGSHRGVRALRAMKEEDVLLELPRRLLLDEAYADASDARVLWNETNESLPGYLKLALLVLHERRGGEEASLSPYIVRLRDSNHVATLMGISHACSPRTISIHSCSHICDGPGTAADA